MTPYKELLYWDTAWTQWSKTLKKSHITATQTNLRSFFETLAILTILLWDILSDFQTLWHPALQQGSTKEAKKTTTHYSGGISKGLKPSDQRRTTSTILFVHATIRSQEVFHASFSRSLHRLWLLVQLWLRLLWPRPWTKKEEGGDGSCKVASGCFFFAFLLTDSFIDCTSKAAQLRLAQIGCVLAKHNFAVNQMG